MVYQKLFCGANVRERSGLTEVDDGQAMGGEHGSLVSFWWLAVAFLGLRAIGLVALAYEALEEERSWPLFGLLAKRG